MEYNASERAGPKAVHLEMATLDEVPSFYMKYELLFLWSLARLSTSDNAAYGHAQRQGQCVPGWSGFCCVTQLEQLI